MNQAAQCGLSLGRWLEGWALAHNEIAVRSGSRCAQACSIGWRPVGVTVIPVKTGGSTTHATSFERERPGASSSGYRTFRAAAQWPVI